MDKNVPAASIQPKNKACDICGSVSWDQAIDNRVCSFYLRDKY